MCLGACQVLSASTYIRYGCTMYLRNVVREGVVCMEGGLKTLTLTHRLVEVNTGIKITPLTLYLGLCT